MLPPASDINTTKAPAPEAVVASQPAAKPVVVDLSQPSKKNVWDFLKEDPNVETLSDRMKQFSPGKIVAIFKPDLMSAVVVNGLDCNQINGPEDVSFLMWVIGLPKMSREKKLETLGLAVDHGADVNYVSKALGEIPVLFVAIVFDNPDAIKFLSTKKVDFKYKNSAGINALIFAAANKKYDSAEFLIATKEIDLNAEDAKGITALMVAASQNDERMVKILLTGGADPKYLSKKLGCVAYAFAVGRDGYENVAKLLDPSASSISTTASVSFGSGAAAVDSGSKDEKKEPSVTTVLVPEPKDKGKEEKNELKAALEHATDAIKMAAHYAEKSIRPAVKEGVAATHEVGVTLNQVVGLPIEHAVQQANQQVFKPVIQGLFGKGGVFRF